MSAARSGSSSLLTPWAARWITLKSPSGSAFIAASVAAVPSNVTLCAPRTLAASVISSRPKRSGLKLALRNSEISVGAGEDLPSDSAGALYATPRKGFVAPGNCGTAFSAQ